MSLVVAACTATPIDQADLQAENERLREEIAALRAGSEPETPTPNVPIPTLTIGLAAAESDFDQGAFETLLTESLATTDPDVRVVDQSSAREVAKIRGMLVQQYLAAEEIPILISNLSFKLKDANQAFKIGGTVVPRDRAQLQSTSDEGSVYTHVEDLPAVLRRGGSGGNFAIEYEELGQNRGAVEANLTDLEMIAAADGTRAGRHGDISFNWRLNLAQVRVYQVEGFRGDVGRFLRRMRLGGSSGELSPFQTLQDSVLLFGYGSYRTDVVSQLKTPAFIDQVEVAAIAPERVAELTRDDDEDVLLTSLGSAIEWKACELIDFRGRDRVWRRPVVVGFPFVSRQTSSSRGEVFYSVYSAEGTRLLGNFAR